MAYKPFILCPQEYKNVVQQSDKLISMDHIFITEFKSVFFFARKMHFNVRLPASFFKTYNNVFSYNFLCSMAPRKHELGNSDFTFPGAHFFGAVE